jgi:hypothetical protein
MDIALFFARKEAGGGSTSFTAHLHRALKLAGYKVKLFGFTDKPREPRLLGKYAGVTWNFVTPKEAKHIVRNVPSLLTGPDHSKVLAKTCGESTLIHDLINLGMRVVVHDPNEFRVYDHLTNASIKQPICIRPTMRKFFPDAIFIPHPYVRSQTGWHGKDIGKRYGVACSIARISFVKRTEIILEANRLLPKGLEIKLLGQENRLYTYHKIKKLFPEFKQGGYGFPLTWGASALQAMCYSLAVDLTYLPDDGGGSQYSFMDSWDAGTVNVIHRDWLRYPGEMNHIENCLAINSAEHLAQLVKSAAKDKKVQQLMRGISLRGTEHLDRVHSPEAVAARYAEVVIEGIPYRRFPRGRK